MKTNQLRNPFRAQRMSAVFMFAMILLLGCSQNVRAQQWTTNGNNISNTNTGNVGIGTSTPGGKLDVQLGNGNDLLVRAWNTATSSGGAIFRAAAASGNSEAARLELTDNGGFNGGVAADRINGLIFRTGNQSPSYLGMGVRMTIAPGGNVGIGTTTPANFLDVYAGTTDTSSIRIRSNGTTVGGAYLYSGDPSVAIMSGGAEKINGSWIARSAAASLISAEGSNIVFYTNPGLTPGNSFGPTQRMRIDGSGRVGIGTIAPDNFLDVNAGSTDTSSIRIRSNNTTVGGGYLYSGHSGVAIMSGGAEKISGSWTARSSGATLISAEGGNAVFYTNFGLTPGNTFSPTPRMWIQNNGNVGIGTGAPAAKLDVVGLIRSSSGGFVFPDGSVQTTAAAGGGGGGGTITGVLAGAGLSGGGTSGTVTLTNEDRGTSQFIFKNIANAAGATQFSAGLNNDSLRFEGTGGTSVTFDAGTKKVIINGSASIVPAANVSAGDFGQNTGGGNYSFPANLGIGTTVPTSKLHVAGDGRFTGNLIVDGNIAAKYQDLAEWVPTSQALPAGTVVTLDPTKSNHVEASSKSYDTRVAGVVSSQPGLILGEAGENKVLVATTGRVRIKVDASRGPIEVGDLLVTSDVPGVAMKSQPINVGGVHLHRPGTLIGKALEPLNKGMGEVFALLSLQ